MLQKRLSSTNTLVGQEISVLLPDSKGNFDSHEQHLVCFAFFAILWLERLRFSNWLQPTFTGAKYTSAKNACKKRDVAKCGSRSLASRRARLAQKFCRPIHWKSSSPPGRSRRLRIVPVTSQKFTRALQVQTLEQPKNAWDFQIGALTTAAPIKKGDVLLATFWMRASQTQAGYGRTDVVFEDATTYNKSVYFSVASSAVWKQFFVPFVAAQDELAGAGVLHFHLGFLPQTIELADIRLTNYSNRVALADLPKTQFSYEGRALNAPWRKAAAARIESIRKGNLTIRVLDTQGKAVPNARVQVTMTRHAFRFGTAVSQPFIGDSADAKKYRQVVQDNFNTAVEGRALKFWDWEQAKEEGRGLTPAFQSVKAIHGLGLAMRGHNLVWPSWLWMPKLKPMANDPAALSKRITDHITEEMTALKGQCDEWDVHQRAL